MMANEVRKPLDLDELFGQARAIKVRWEGKEYDLIQLEALGPREIVQFKKMHWKASNLQINSVSEEINDAQADEIVELFDQMMEMICKEFPKDAPFAIKARALEYYVVEMEGKKKIETPEPRTGERRSRK
jgi:hypothetical protein